ncbi:MAG: thioesterase family protein [Ardenticatenaceae bacterium]
MDDTQLWEKMREVIEEKIVFNKVLGIKVASLAFGHVCVRIDMQEHLVGNFMHGILHGGVTAAVLDLVGGITAWTGVMEKMKKHPTEEKVKRFAQLGTIDIRIDYLRPGRGKSFLATGTTLRVGKKIAVTRMELHNEQGVLIAAGAGTYNVG